MGSDKKAEFGLVHVIEASPGYNRIAVQIMPGMLFTTDIARTLIDNLQKAIQFVESGSPPPERE
jgi:hypothetical protein